MNFLSELSHTEIAGYLSFLLAILSVIIGGLFKIKNSCFKFDAKATFVSKRSIGNTITLTNLNDHPVILEYWELLYKPKYLPIIKAKLIEHKSPLEQSIRISAHESIYLTFDDAYYFDAFKIRKTGNVILIKLNFAGKQFAKTWKLKNNK